MKLWYDIWRVTVWPSLKWLAVRPYWIARFWLWWAICLLHAAAGYWEWQKAKPTEAYEFSFVCKACGAVRLRRSYSDYM